MKKQLLTFMLTFIGIVSYLQAQPYLSKSCNLMRDGDNLVKQQIVYKAPGRSGENVFWDFSRQESVNDHYTLAYQAPGDSLIIGIENRTLYKYVQTGDTVFSYGFENPTTLVDHIRPEFHLIYPFRYKDSYESYFHGNGDYGNRLFLTVRGKSSVEADAWGVMLLPSGDTLRHVLRVHNSRKIVQRMVPYNCIQPGDTIFCTDSIDYHWKTDSVTLQTETYRWYADGYRYPVFETVETTTLLHGKPAESCNTAFFYTPGDQYYDVNNDPDNQLKRDAEQARIEAGDNQPAPSENSNEEEIISYNTALTGGGNELVIDYCLTADADVSFMLFDIQSRQLTGITRNRQPAGIYHETLSLAGFPAGEYTLRIVVNGKAFGQKIVK